MKSKHILLFLGLLLLLVLLAAIDLFFGSTNLSPHDFMVWLSTSENTQNSLILSEIRLPRLLTALFSGAALAVAGLLMQSIFQNPLAGPYVLGVSSGASLGVAIVLLGSQIIFSGLFILQSRVTLLLGAFAGSLSIIMLIIIIARHLKSLTTLLILGILFSGATSALINILQYFAQAADIKTYVVWTLGNLGGMNLNESLLLSGLIILSLLPTLLSVKALDAFSLGEEEASNLGINVIRWRYIILISAGMLTAIVTAFVGPIAFVGIIIPHISRILFNSFRHIIILPAAILLGSSLLVFADFISRIPGTIYSIPINSITSLIGIPIVAYLLISKKQIIF